MSLLVVKRVTSAHASLYLWGTSLDTGPTTRNHQIHLDPPAQNLYEGRKSCTPHRTFTGSRTRDEGRRIGGAESEVDDNIRLTDYDEEPKQLLLSAGHFHPVSQTQYGT